MSKRPADPKPRPVEVVDRRPGQNNSRALAGPRPARTKKKKRKKSSVFTLVGAKSAAIANDPGAKAGAGEGTRDADAEIEWGLYVGLARPVAPSNTAHLRITILALVVPVSFSSPSFFFFFWCPLQALIAVVSYLESTFLFTPTPCVCFPWSFRSSAP